MAESALINSEESIMATFDFLASENVEDEDNSDEENDERQGDDENEDRILVKRAKTKVKLLYAVLNTFADIETLVLSSDCDVSLP